MRRTVVVAHPAASRVQARIESVFTWWPSESSLYVALALGLPLIHDLLGPDLDLLLDGVADALRLLETLERADEGLGVDDREREVDLGLLVEEGPRHRDTVQRLIDDVLREVADLLDLVRAAGLRQAVLRRAREPVDLGADHGAHLGAGTRAGGLHPEVAGDDLVGGADGAEAVLQLGERARTGLEARPERAVALAHLGDLVRYLLAPRAGGSEHDESGDDPSHGFGLLGIVYGGPAGGLHPRKKRYWHW